MQLPEGYTLLLECVSGSKAYGLDGPESDTDIKGVYLLPKSEFYGLGYTPQISDANNDQVYYEFGRFMELLSVNNPNILELLASPPEAVRYKHPAMQAIRSEDILSKRCKDSFGKFALSQIKKARGLKKKIVNPVGRERKGPLSFCQVNRGSGSVPLLDFLSEKGWRQEDCGLVDIPKMKGIYGLYHDPKAGFKGLLQSEASNSLSLSSIPKGMRQQALLYFNKDGYSKYCKDYREYWKWVEKRNESRYQNTRRHGQGYDSKNMMHTFRLLAMATEIATQGRLNVRRPDRDFLLAVKAGEYRYEELLALAEEKQREMEAAFAVSTLPDHPNPDTIAKITRNLRELFYG